MRKNTDVRLLCMICLLLALSIGVTLVYADSSVSMVSGRLGAAYDNQTGNVTAMVAGYCEGRPFTLGPVTWALAQKRFSSLKAEDVATVLCGEDFAIQKITKSENNGREIVADILITKSGQ